jgi:hypothetical protein
VNRRTIHAILGSCNPKNHEKQLKTPVKTTCQCHLPGWNEVPVTASVDALPLSKLAGLPEGQGHWGRAAMAFYIIIWHLYAFVSKNLPLCMDMKGYERRIWKPALKQWKQATTTPPKLHFVNLIPPHPPNSCCLITWRSWNLASRRSSRHSGAASSTCVRVSVSLSTTHWDVCMATCQNQLDLEIL